MGCGAVRCDGDVVWCRRGLRWRRPSRRVYWKVWTRTWCGLCHRRHCRDLIITYDVVSTMTTTAISRVITSTCWPCVFRLPFIDELSCRPTAIVHHHAIHGRVARTGSTRLAPRCLATCLPRCESCRVNGMPPLAHASRHQAQRTTCMRRLPAFVSPFLGVDGVARMLALRSKMVCKTSVGACKRGASLPDPQMHHLTACGGLG